MHNKKIYLLVGICLVFLMAKSADAIVINEIMYAPSDDWGGIYNEWIELYNNEMETIELIGWTIDGKTIPETIIHSGEYLIIAKDDIKFNEFYPNVSCDVLKVAILLTNSGETITLNDTTSTIIDSIDYTEYASDGLGYKNNKTLEQNTASGWKESSVHGGTPGLKNSVSSTNSEQNTTAEPKTIPIYVNVIGKKPYINNITISPDYYD
ncbi:MAG: lamin tail domain-containing protein, partial [Nanoarchaeota archaeon]|nr:lamin tail domain-containing protein [Nanoarchaeota archaeon]